MPPPRSINNAECFDFEVTDSEYADDTAVFFNSREELVRWTPRLFQCFADFGLEVHARKPGTTKDKTEVLFCAAPPRSYCSDFPDEPELKVGDKRKDADGNNRKDTTETRAPLSSDA